MTTKATPATTRNAGRRAAATPARLARGLTQGMAMDCAAFEQELAQVADRNLLAAPAQAHLALCRACSDLVDDFAAIAERVRLLSLAEPVPDLWPDIRKRLQQEGIIHNGDCEAENRLPRLVHRAPSR